MNLNFIWLAIGQIVDPTVAAYALATIGLVIHFGFTGLLNFGQAGFMAVGGYAFAITSVKFEWPVWGSLLATIVVLAILGYNAYARRGARRFMRLVGAAGTALLGIFIVLLEYAIH